MSLATYILLYPHIYKIDYFICSSLLKSEFCIFAWCKSLIEFEFVLVTKDPFLCMVTEI